MATYALLMLLTLAVSYLAVLVYRRITHMRVSTIDTISLRDASLVSLSQGSGQWSVGLQQGFVRTQKRGVRPVAKTRARRMRKVSRKNDTQSSGSIKRPWGW